MRYDHKNALDIAVRDHGNRPPPGPANPSAALYPCTQICQGMWSALLAQKTLMTLCACPFLVNRSG